MKRMDRLKMQLSAAVLIAAGVAAWGSPVELTTLPNEYQQVEHLESNGSQWIDTGVVINENHELQFKYAMLVCTEYRGPFGSYVSESANTTRLMANNGSQTDLCVHFMTRAGGGGTIFSGVTTQAGDVVEGYMNLTKACLNGQEKSLSRTVLGTADTSTMKLLGRSGYSTSIRLYYFRILEGGVLKHEYIPCYLRSNPSSVGLYDTIGREFYTATGLVKGEDVQDFVFNFVAGDEYDYQGGEEVRPAFTLKRYDYTLQEGTDYTAVYANNRNRGVATVTITGIGDYEVMGTMVKEFRIGCGSISDSALTGIAFDTRTDPVREAECYSDILPFVFIDGETITVTCTDDGTSDEMNGAVDSTVSWAPPGLGRFVVVNGSLSSTLYVSRLVCDFAFAAGDEYDYQGGAEVRPAFTLKDGDYVLREGVDYTVAYADNVNHGEATLTITGAGRYAQMEQFVKTFTIRPAAVSSSSWDGALDTRTDEIRVINGSDELQVIAYNNAVDWVKGGDTGADAACVRMTPMIGIRGGIANWSPAGAPVALATVPGEATLNWMPPADFSAYRAELLVGGAVVGTAYLNLTGAEFVERVKATVAGGAAMTVSVAPIEGQAVEGELSYRWYVYGPSDTWYDCCVATSEAFTPGLGHYEKKLRVLVFDGSGYAGMSEELWCSKLPVVYIDTKGVEVVSKEVDVEATMRIQGNARFNSAKQLYDGKMTMHVRGNQTALAEKKPYKLKLDKKTDIFGMGKNKHWVLLANAYDMSLLRNKTAYDLSGEMGLTYMSSEWVEVMLNGEYIGNYQLCEHIRVGEERVDIYDWEGAADEVAGTIAEADGFSESSTKNLETYLEQHLDWTTTGEFTWTNGKTYRLDDYEKINREQFDLSGGYLFELDYTTDEVTWFYAGSADGRIRAVTKVNRPEYLNTNSEMLDYVQTMWNNFWSACVAPDGYWQGVHYTQMSSIESMAAYWLVQTLMGQRDMDRSRYVYKPVGDLLQWGPVWDFDHSCGGPSGWTFDANGEIISRFDARSGWEPGVYRANSDMFFKEWVDDPYFVLKAFEKLNEMKNYLDDLLRPGGLLDENVDYLFESGVANAERWAGRITQGVVISPFMRFDGQNGDVQWFRDNLRGRVDWIRNEMRSVRSAVASLRWTKSKNPYTDSANNFAFNFTMPYMARPVEGEGEGPTPDIMVANNIDLEAQVTLTGLSSPATVDVFVNGLSNGTYAVEANVVAFTVSPERFTNTGGHRNMISLVAKNASGAVLATTYALVTTVDERYVPKQLGEAVVTVDVGAEVVVTGEPIRPAVTITAGEGEELVTLIEGEDYRVEYLDNVDCGRATVRITGLGNLSGTGDFPRGNWIGSIVKTFEIVCPSVSNASKRRLALDTRADAVRKLLSSRELLPFAWNNAAEWPQGGEGETQVSVVLQPMIGESANPTGWTASGAARTPVNAAGEGVKRVRATRLENSLYKATLSDGAEMNEEAYFDLRGMEKVSEATMFYLK